MRASVVILGHFIKLPAVLIGWHHWLNVPTRLRDTSLLSTYPESYSARELAHFWLVCCNCSHDASTVPSLAGTDTDVTSIFSYLGQVHHEEHPGHDCLEGPMIFEVTPCQGGVRVDQSQAGQEQEWSLTSFKDTVLCPQQSVSYSTTIANLLIM